VAGAKRPRRADGAASVGRGVPAQMEAAAAQAVGGPIRGYPAVTAASERGRRARRSAQAVAVATCEPRARNGEAGGATRRCRRR